MSSIALEKKIVVNEAGEPLEVIIPYDRYIEFVETYGLDLSEEEKEGLREARADVKNKNLDAFVDADDLDVELGCIK